MTATSDAAHRRGTADDDLPLAIADAGARIRDGRLTSQGLVEALLARADRIDVVVGTYLLRRDDQTVEAARAADAELAAGKDRGPLHGIPVGIKDVIGVDGWPITAQSLVLDRRWDGNRDATVVGRLRQAGAIIMGKTTTSEFGIGLPDPEKPFPIPRNPWDRDRWSGGSSAGSGNGVGAGMFPVAIGTDAGGSVRQPAAYCGVTGLYPTYGRVPKGGCVQLTPSIGRVGPLARTARDCAVVLGIIAGADPADATSVDRPVPDYVAALSGRLDGVRIGVHAVHRGLAGVDPQVDPAFEQALATLVDLGATTVEVTPPCYDEAKAAFSVTMVSEALAYHQRNLQTRWEDYFAGTRLAVAQGSFYTGADYVRAQRVRRWVQRQLAAMFEKVDLVASPTMGQGAPTFASMGIDHVQQYYDLSFTNYWSAVGNPAIALPMGFTADGLPLSLQLAGRPFADEGLLSAADAYQSVTDWHLRRPAWLEQLAAGQVSSGEDR